MAPIIVKELGPHSNYWEPFCGSMAVLFEKEPSRMESVCDLHGDLINLARVLAKEETALRLYVDCERILYSTQLYDDFMRIMDGPIKDPVEAATAFMVTSWMGRNGTSGSVRTNFAPSVRFTSGGGSSPTRWKSAVESIPFWHQRLRNVCILHQDAFDIIPKIADEITTVIYADPPYLKNTRGHGGGSMYLHDFNECDSPLFKEGDDHKRLADLLRGFKKARVVVSYYEDERLEALYPGWTKVNCERFKNLHVQNKRGNAQSIAPEVLLINGPSYARDSVLPGM